MEKEKMMTKIALQQQEIMEELAALCRELLEELGRFRAIEDEERLLAEIENRREEGKCGKP